MSQRPPALDAPRTLSPRDIALLLASTAGRRHAVRDRCLLLLMFRHGLRVSEACGLTLAHVDMPTERSTSGDSNTVAPRHSRCVRMNSRPSKRGCGNGRRCSRRRMRSL